MLCKQFSFFQELITLTYQLTLTCQRNSQEKMLMSYQYF